MDMPFNYHETEHCSFSNIFPSWIWKRNSILIYIEKHDTVNL